MKSNQTDLKVSQLQAKSIKDRQANYLTVFSCEREPSNCEIIMVFIKISIPNIITNVLFYAPIFINITCIITTILDIFSLDHCKEYHKVFPHIYHMLVKFIIIAIMDSS